MTGSPMTMTVPEVARAFGVGEKTYREAIARGDAPVMPMRIGRRMVFPVAHVHAALGLNANEAPVAADASIIDFPVTGPARGVSGGA